MKHVETIYGVHAVRAMLTRHPDRVLTVKLTDARDDPRAREIEDLARKSGRTVQRIDARALKQALGDVTHQGVVADIEPLPPWTEDDLLSALPLALGGINPALVLPECALQLKGALPARRLARDEGVDLARQALGARDLPAEESQAILNVPQIKAEATIRRGAYSKQQGESQA